MEERYKLFDNMLSALHKAGVLSELILIGSWCQYMYKYALRDTDEIPALITSDIDFLIPYPTKIKNDFNVPDILADLGFEIVVSPVSGYTKYIRRELEVEFLIPEVGRGSGRPRSVKELHINAQGLRYLTMLQDYLEKIDYRDIPVTIVQPEAYILHKFLISGRRTKPEKRDKDLASAIQMSEYVMKYRNRVAKMKDILKSIHPKWKRDILSVVKMQMPGLYEKL